MTGYWPSYNIPFHPSIYVLSGYKEVWEKHGEEFSYDLCPRAKIFRRDQADVNDLDSLKHIMRSNGAWLPTSRWCPGISWWPNSTFNFFPYKQALQSYKTVFLVLCRILIFVADDVTLIGLNLTGRSLWLTPAPVLFCFVTHDRMLNGHH